MISIQIAGENKNLFRSLNHSSSLRLELFTDHQEAELK